MPLRTQAMVYNILVTDVRAAAMYPNKPVATFQSVYTPHHTYACKYTQDDPPDGPKCENKSAFYGSLVVISIGAHVYASLYLLSLLLSRSLLFLSLFLCRQCLPTLFYSPSDLCSSAHLSA